MSDQEKVKKLIEQIQRLAKKHEEVEARMRKVEEALSKKATA